MSLIIQKYGGSSVATTEKIQFVAKKIVDAKRQGNELVVTVSAMGKTTDSLVALAKQLHSKPPAKELDLLLSTGEMVSVALLCMAIENLGEEAEGFPGHFAGIKTDSSHTKARIQKIQPQRIINELKQGKIVIVAGFQGLSPEEAITTMGRGASDLTAIALAAALKADRCEIYTDVEGVFTADPNKIPQAKLLPIISYEEMLELASTGTKVMQSRAVEFAKKYHVEFTVKSTFKEGAGTMIKEIDFKEGAEISAVSLDENEAKLTLYNVPNKPGIAAKVFDALGKANINVDMIVQNMGKDNHADISFTVSSHELEEAVNTVKQVQKDTGTKKMEYDSDIAKLSAIGTGMMNHPGVAGRMFKALADAEINIEMISTSEIKISCVVRKQDGEKGLKAVHKEFLEKANF